jgi:hypothetical protein
MKTYNQIVELLIHFAKNQPQIHSHKYYGSVDQINSEEIKHYPHIAVLPNKVQIEDVQTQLTFDVLYLDLLKADGSNVLDVQSDSVTILKQLRTYVDELTEFEFTVDSVSEIVPFSERFPDFCAGSGLRIVITTDMEQSRCEIPGISEDDFQRSDDGSTFFASRQFLTCENILNCSTLTNYVTDYVSTHSSTGSTFTLPYKSYSFLLSQDGSTNAPTAITLENGLAGIMSFIHSSDGNYILSSSTGSFTINKTMVLMQSIPTGYHVDENTYITANANALANQITFEIGLSGGGASDVGFNKHPVEIRVYN